MFYQLRANLFFRDDDAIDDIVDKIHDHFSDAHVVNPGAPNQECSEYQVLVNHHDSDPNEPCFELNSWDNCPRPQ